MSHILQQPPESCTVPVNWHVSKMQGKSNPLRPHAQVCVVSLVMTCMCDINNALGSPSFVCWFQTSTSGLIFSETADDSCIIIVLLGR